MQEHMEGPEDTMAMFARAHLAVPQIPVIQSFSSAFSHLSPTFFALQVLVVGVESEVTETEVKGKLHSASLKT